MASLREVTQPSKHKVDPRRIDPSTPYLGLEHIEAHTRRIIGQAKAKDAQSAKGVFRGGDVLYGKLRPYLNKVCIPTFDGVCSTDILVFPQRPEIDSRYLMYFLNRPQVVEEMGHAMAGAQLPRVGFGTLGELQFPLPPLAEQQRIAEKLTELANRLASLRAQLQLAPSLVHYASMAAILAGCTGQLTSAWRSAHNSTSDPAHAVSRVWEQRRSTLAKKRHRFHSRFVDPSLPDVEDLPELPDLPSGWLWTSVGFVASRIQYGSSARSDASASNGIPNLGMQNIQSGRIDLAGMKYVERGSEEIPGLLLQPGDLLFNRTNSPELVGKAAVFSESMKAIFASYLVRVQLEGELAIPQFVCHWINSPWGRMWAEKVKSDGVSQSNINSTKLAEMPLPLPPLDEQIAICELLNRVLSLLQSVTARAERGLSQAEAIMKSCSQMAFSGILVETEASIAAINGTGYETGEQLLARIRSQPLPPTAPTRSSQEKSAVKSKDSPRDALQRAVDAMPQRRFSFDDLRAKLTDDYDAIRDALFQLLDTPHSGVKQVFDAKTKTMMLERVSK